MEAMNGPFSQNEGRPMKGSEVLVQSILDEDVDTVFGYPGGVLLDLYDALFQTPRLKHVLVRHEQGAVHAADAFARVTGKPGVVIVTSGPGATNTVTGIATAYMDSVPLVIFTGQVSSGLIGNDAFQEADIVGVTRPITKHSYLVRDASQIQKTVREAFHIAATGRPGPVLVDLPKDIMAGMSCYNADMNVKLNGYQPVYQGHSTQITKAAALMNDAEKPVIYAGGGVISGEASDALTRIARKGNIPVLTTLMGLGAFPEDDDLALGMVGMHGTWTANHAITECDLLVAVGARFDDRVTGKISAFSPHSKKIHIDIDPASIAKIVPIDVPVVGHVSRVLPALEKAVTRQKRPAWIQQIQAWKSEHPMRYDQSPGSIPGPYVVEQVAEVTSHNALVVTDVGQNQMWAAQFYGYRNPRSFLTSGGLGTMGYGLPAAMGAAMAAPDQTVVCITGDGGFQMNMQELATARLHRLPLKVVVLNNGFLGMVRQWQELFYDRRYAHTCLQKGNPDFMKLAEGYGCAGFRVSSAEEVKPVLQKAMKINHRPVVMEFLIQREQNVFPMVPAGGALTEMITGGAS